MSGFVPRRSSMGARAMADASAAFTCERHRGLDVTAISKGQNTAGQGAEPAPRRDGALVNLAAEVRGKEVDAAQRPGFAGPERLVALGAPQEVERPHAFVDRGAKG